MPDTARSRRGGTDGRARARARHPRRSARCAPDRRARPRRAHGRRRRRSTTPGTAISRRTGSWRACSAGLRGQAFNSSGTPKCRAGAIERQGRDTRLALRDGREVEADEFVLCAGAWSAGLAQKARASSFRCRPARATASRCPPAPVAAPLRHPHRSAHRGDAHGRRAALRRHDGARGPERGRSVPRACAASWTRCRATTPSSDPRISTGVAPWRGLRPCSPDGLPYIGRTAACSNLVGGHGPCDDGDDARADHRPAGGGNPVGREAGDRYRAALAGPVQPVITGYRSGRSGTCRRSTRAISSSART